MDYVFEMKGWIDDGRRRKNGDDEPSSSSSSKSTSYLPREKDRELGRRSFEASSFYFFFVTIIKLLLNKRLAIIMAI